MPDTTTTDQQPEPLVRADHVQKSYGDTPVLTDVTCTINPGITGLLGANGAGKTTFLGMLLGLHKPTAGTLEVFGLSPTKYGSGIRERIGYGPEHHRLPPNLRAVDFVRHIGEIHGLPPADATTRASDALWLVDLGEERFRPMGTMSTGQRQRVKLAQAIVHDPYLVLLDEPTDGLDPGQRHIMLDLISSVAADFGISIIISSHLMNEVEQVCDQAVVIGDGKVVAYGAIAEIRGEDTTRLTIELDTNPDRVAQLGEELRTLLAAKNPRADVQVNGRELTVAGADDQVQADVLSHCVDENVGVTRLHYRGGSLEDALVARML